MLNYTNTTTVTELSSVENTILGRVAIKVYNGSLINSNYDYNHSPEEYLDVEGHRGKILYCPSSEQNSRKYVELQVRSNNRGPKTSIGSEGINRYFVYREGDSHSDENIFSECYDSLSSSQTSIFDRIITKDFTQSGNSNFNKLNADRVLDKFGNVTITTTDYITTNTNYLVPANCSNICPEGQCSGPIIEPISFSTQVNSTETSIFNGCRRVVGSFLHAGPLVDPLDSRTHNVIRSAQDICGLPLICDVDYTNGNLIAYLKVNESLLSDHENPFIDYYLHVKDVVLSGLREPRQDIDCYVDFSHGLYSLQDLVYLDGDCSEVLENSCLSNSEQHFDDLGKIIATKTVTNRVIHSNYVTQECLEPVCGFEYCPITETSSLEMVTSLMPTTTILHESTQIATQVATQDILPTSTISFIPNTIHSTISTIVSSVDTVEPSPTNDRNENDINQQNTNDNSTLILILTCVSAAAIFTALFSIVFSILKTKSTTKRIKSLFNIEKFSIKRNSKEHKIKETTV